LLKVSNLQKALGQTVLREISFEVHPQQYLVLLGESGVGKTILLEIIAGLLQPDGGHIFLDGKEITSERIPRRGIGLVFQDNTLFPHLSVYDNIAYPLKAKSLGFGTPAAFFHGWEPLRSRSTSGKRNEARLSRSQINKRVLELAQDFECTGLLNRKPSTLSAGETKRVSLARALAGEPHCLLLDEPLSSLDIKARPQIRRLLHRINARGRAIVHVTHEYTEAVSLATHIAVMEKGTIVQVGTAEEIFQRPKSEFVARFVGIRNFLKGKLQETSPKNKTTKQFTSDGLSFRVLTDDSGAGGYLMFRSEDVTISNSPIHSSARNNFEGLVTDILPAGSGVEVVVNIGKSKPVKLASLITRESTEALNVREGKRVWVSFKASAVKFVRE